MNSSFRSRSKIAFAFILNRRPRKHAAVGALSLFCAGWALDRAVGFPEDAGKWTAPLRAAMAGEARASLPNVTDSEPAIAWTNREITTLLDVQQASFRVSFSFKIRGRRSVAVRSATASCDCVSIDFDPKEYEPNEQGEISATFHSRERVGQQTVLVEVHTSDPLEPTVLLRLQMTLFDEAGVAPTLLQWARGAKPGWKRAAIAVRDATRARPVLLNYDEGLLEAAIMQGEEPGRYFLVVRPRATDRPSNGRLRLQILNGERRFDLPLVYARVL